MDKMIVAVFDNETQAYEATQAIRDMHNEGSLIYYGGAVIRKTGSGISSIEAAEDDSPTGTLFGAAFGGLMGAAIGGPAGMLLGGAVGGWTGLIADTYNLDVGTDFVSHVAGELENGKYAVVAQVDEEWTTPVDSRMAEIGGEVFRRGFEEIEEDQWTRDYEASREELQQIEEEWNQSVGEAKQKLQEKLDAARAKVQESKDQLQAKYEAFQADTQAKIEALQDRIKTATDETKAKLEARKQELEADYERRSAKLSQAWSCVKEAVAHN